MTFPGAPPQKINYVCDVEGTNNKGLRHRIQNKFTAKLILGSMTFLGSPSDTPQNKKLRAFNFPLKILHFLIDNLLRNGLGAVGALQGVRRLNLLHVGFGISQNLILGSMAVWAPQPDDYIYFIIWPPTNTFASFLIFVFCGQTHFR